MNRKFNIKNITTASVLMAALTSGAALSADSDKSFMVRLSVDGKVSVPEWVTINYVYGNWGNVGAPHSCQNWVAPTDTIDWGESYQQSRLCKQTQNRTETPILFNPVLKITKEGAPTVGSRDVSTTEFRPAIGTRDYIAKLQTKTDVTDRTGANRLNALIRDGLIQKVGHGRYKKLACG